MGPDAWECERKSAERWAFEHYLRTGRRMSAADVLEQKFNPYHDPRNGRFTFAPGGPRSVINPIFADRRGLWKPKNKHLRSAQLVMPVPRQASSGTPGSNDIEQAPTETRHPHQYRPNPRARIGGNGGPPLNDPRTVEQAIPDLKNAPAGAVLAIPDIFFDLTGPAQATLVAVHDSYTKALIREIQSIDPDYRFETLGPAGTLEGRVNEIMKLRWDRAAAIYKTKGDTRPLQTEALRFIQARVDAAYEEGAALYEAGDLKPRLSRNEAIGNYVDREVRNALRTRFQLSGIDHSPGQPVRVVGRQYDTSGSRPTYVVPDARVGLGDIDWTLEPKTLAKKQIRGNFNSDIRPEWTAIIRPRQLGPGHSYLIKTPRR